MDDLNDMTAEQFIAELMAVAADEEAGITDIPVDDLLRAAAVRVGKLVDLCRAHLNDKQRAEDRLDYAERDARTWETHAHEVEGMNDKLSLDMDELLRAAHHQGFTEWVDSDGIVRPIPVPWPIELNEDGKYPIPPPKSFTSEDMRNLYKAFPPTLWAPKPPKDFKFTDIVAT